MSFVLQRYGGHADRGLLRIGHSTEECEYGVVESNIEDQRPVLCGASQHLCYFYRVRLLFYILRTNDVDVYTIYYSVPDKT